MKKILLGILTCLLVACISLSVACGSKTSFAKPDMTNPGAIVSDGGFLAETENYLYVINGVGTSTEDNTFGAAVKGSLVAIEKSSIGSDELKAQVIVPKLMVATDYTAGIFIHDNYVYYGTPCTDKNSSGDIANNEMTFMRTKLDGTQESGDIYFTLSSLSIKYRIVQSDNVVYIIYNDTSDSSIKVYNTSSKSTSVIAKTDTKNNDAVKINEKDVYVSLGTITFGEESSDVAMLYTVNVYTEKYSDKKAEDNSSYSRATAKYNLVYAVNNKGESKLILDGSKDNLTFAITLVKDGYVFYTATDVNSSAKTYGKEIKNIFDEKGNETATVIDNATYITADTVIKSLNEIYYLDEITTSTSESGESTTTGTGNIIKSTLVGKESAVKENLALGTSASTLLGVFDGYAYYNNSNGEIAKIKLGDADAKECRVSSGSVNTAWYTPEFIKIGDKTYLFYCDTTTVGSSYVWYVDLSAKEIEEDTDDDGESDSFYLPKGNVAGIMLGKDKANIAVSAINDIESVLEWTTDDQGKRIVQSVIDARAAYESIGDAKEHVGESYVTKLENAEKAIALGEKYYALKGVKQYDDLSDDKKAEYKKNYETATSFRQSIINDWGKDRYQTVRDMLNDELKSYYYQATQEFDAE